MTINANNMEALREKSLMSVKISETIDKQGQQFSEGSHMTSLLSVKTFQETLLRLDQEIVQVIPQTFDPLRYRARRRSSRSAEAARLVVDDEEQWQKMKLSMKGMTTMMIKQHLDFLLKDRIRDLGNPSTPHSFAPTPRRLSAFVSGQVGRKIVNEPKRWSIGEEKVRRITIITNLEKLEAFEAALSV